MNILIAEDDLISRRLLETALMKQEHKVVVTCNGNEAWDAIKKPDAPQLAVLDWMMPGMDGVDICTKLKKCNGGRFVYIILLTAKGRKDDIAVGLDAGADDYVTKPFSTRELFARVKVGARMIDLQNKLAQHVKKLQEFDKLKSDFLSTVSHELRTPIAVMKGGVSLVLDGVTGEINETQKDVLTDTLDNIDRLGRIVTDLLDVQKIEAGKMVLRRSVIDLCGLVQKTQRSFNPEAEKKRIRLKTNLPEGLLNVYVDSDKMTQIFTNLVSNALRFTEEGGEVIMSVKDGRDVIECGVSDTGIGISKENLTRLFSKFEQFGRIEGPGYKGTGLGLTIAKALVEIHGGKIWVESEPGRGTSFYFTIEKVANPKILLVDDEPKIIDIVKGFLKNENYQILEAYDGIEAVEKARHERLSLILLDMMLPGMSGYEVIGRLKQDRRTHDIPIIVNSAYHVDESRLRKVNENAVIPILKKPIEPELLQEKIREMLVV